MLFFSVSIDAIFSPVGILNLKKYLFFIMFSEIIWYFEVGWGRQIFFIGLKGGATKKVCVHVYTALR